jgi:hypothetical protein
LVVRVSGNGRSKLLFNGGDPVGPKKIVKLAVRGAELSSERSQALVAAETLSGEVAVRR